MPIPIWSGRYIGLPFRSQGRDRAGLDCWGLARLISQEQFGCALPSFATRYKNSTDAEGIARLIEQETERLKDIKLGTEKLGDIIVFNERGAPQHIGTVLGDQCMLHIEKFQDSGISRYSSLRWSDNIYGIFRQ